MVWVQAFPTGATLISQSVQQIQDNWLFLQNNINVNHFFNTGAPTEGGHRKVDLQNLGADPALVLDGVIYNKAVNAKSTPFWRNSDAAWRMPFGTYGTVAYGAGGAPRTLNVLAFPIPGLYLFMASVVGADKESFSCYLSVDGLDVYPYGFQQSSNPGESFTSVANVNTTLTVSTTKAGAFTLRYAYWGMQN